MADFEHREYDKEALKRQFQKQEQPQKIKQKKERQTDIRKYILWLAGFVVFLFLFAVLTDQVIIPAFVHSRSIVETPDVTGLSVREAIDKLESVGLLYKLSNEDIDPSQLVVRQSPRQGAIVKEGRTVYLMANENLPKVRMPQIIGKTLDRARPYLVRQNLFFGTITYEYNDSIGVDTIISQNIPPYMLIPAETNINVVISKGSEGQAIVPNLYLLSLDEAKLALQKVELQLGNVDYISEKTFLPNTVIVQSPIAGEVVPRHTTAVNITVTK